MAIHDHVEYVLGFLYSENKQKVVLILKTKPTWQAGLFNGVGGKIEAGEEPEDAMVREFEEETGMHVPKEYWQKCIYHYNFLENPLRMHVFRAFGDVTQVKTVEEEEVHIVDVNSLPKNKIPNLEWIIPFMLDDTINFPTAIPSN